MGVSAVVAVAAVYGAYEANQTANTTADAQTNIAHATLTQEQLQRQQAAQAAQPNPTEIASMQQEVDLSNQAINRKQQILSSVDPAVMAAGKQALNLMNGQSAAALAPLNQQRALQRVQLQNSLQQRLGSGYATSTAGIQALNSFDSQTANLSTNAQSQTLNQFLGISATASAQGFSQESGMLNNITNQAANQSTRMANALNGNKIDAAGASYAGQLYGAQAQSATTQSNLNTVNTLGNLYNTANSNSNGTTTNTNSPTANYSEYTDNSGENDYSTGATGGANGMAY